MNNQIKKKASGKGVRLEDRIAPAMIGGDLASAFADAAGYADSISETTSYPTDSTDYADSFPVQYASEYGDAPPPPVDIPETDTMQTLTYETTLVDVDISGEGPAGAQYTIQSDVTAQVGTDSVEISGDSSFGYQNETQSGSVTSHTDATMVADSTTGDTDIVLDTTITGPEGQSATIHGEGTASNGEDGESLSGTVTVTGPEGQQMTVDGTLQAQSDDSGGSTVSGAAVITGPGGHSVDVEGSTTIQTGTDGTTQISSSVTVTAPGGHTVVIDGTTQIQSHSDGATTIDRTSTVTGPDGHTATIQGQTNVGTSGAVTSHTATVSGPEGQSVTAGTRTR